MIEQIKSLKGPITEEEKTYLKYRKWMRVVLRRAQVVGERELPISALIIDQKGRCIGRGSNKREINKDPLGHAELIALRQAAWIRNDWRFNDCVMIVNLEPCQMCAGAIIQSRMGKVIFSANDPKRGGLGGTIDLSKHKSAHHKMEVMGGLFEKESSMLLSSWFKRLRIEK